MKTARNLGYATKEELLSKMTAKQVQEWEAFGAIEPFPADRIENALAFIASIFANGTLKKIDKKPWKMEDFLFKYFTPPKKKIKPQPLSEMKKMIMAIGDAFGGKKKENKGLNKYRIKYDAERFIPRRVTPPANPVKRFKRKK